MTPDMLAHIIVALSRDELELIVARIHGVLYPDCGPDAEWTPEELELIAEIFADYNLVPT